MLLPASVTDTPESTQKEKGKGKSEECIRLTFAFYLFNFAFFSGAAARDETNYRDEQRRADD